MDAAGAGEGLGWERLKTDEEVFAIVGAAGAGAGEEEEAEKSKRSFIADEDEGAAAAAGLAAEEKSPNPPKLLCAGLGDGAAGLVSKKLPPLKPENAEED